MQSGMTRRITSEHSEHGESEEIESLGPIKEASTPPKSSTKHSRKKSGTIVADYLQSTGPSSNRKVRVSIVSSMNSCVYEV